MNPDLPLIHTETYRVRNYEADRTGHLSLYSLANYLQDAADRHAAELGVGVAELMLSGFSWVLHRMHIQVHRWPEIPETITVTTNPSGEERVYVYRDYRVLDDSGNLLVSASSSWLVFDLNARKLTVPSVELKRTFEAFHKLIALPRASKKYPTLPVQWRYQTTVAARHNEIDQNRHVNNSVYFQWLLEPLPAVFLIENLCNSVDITFKSECMPGELVLSCCEPLSDNLLIHRLSNERGEAIVIAVSEWVAAM
ncbi:acyl-ACP thioesterase domain-containing protein [Dyadobacter sp. 32]|uniref:acyl-[acyl-carrier-protein] thioesterase n=1 Tax=Dyadobacter sp. 32 TaxID=538966 RepID=UPI0011EF87AD